MKKVKTSRREFLMKSTLAGLAGIATYSLAKNLPADMIIKPVEPSGPEEMFSLLPLPYDFDALEPHIDKMTMEIHYTKHHKGYVDNLNRVVKENNIKGSLGELIKNVSKYPVAVRNNAGGHWNHSFFWKLMTSPKKEDDNIIRGKEYIHGTGMMVVSQGGGMPTGKLAEAINDSFESFDKFKAAFNDAALKRFGSGWAWLVSSGGKLQIGSTPYQDNPLMDVSDFKGKPLIGIDVWEHAYYLKYQNKRADYINAWWNVINWKQVTENFEKA